MWWTHEQCILCTYFIIHYVGFNHYVQHGSLILFGSLQVFVNFAKDQSDEDHIKDISVNKSDAVVDFSQLNTFLMDAKAQETMVWSIRTRHQRTDVLRSVLNKTLVTFLRYFSIFFLCFSGVWAQKRALDLRHTTETKLNANQCKDKNPVQCGRGRAWCRFSTSQRYCVWRNTWSLNSIFF